MWFDVEAARAGRPQPPSTPANPASPANPAARIAGLAGLAGTRARISPATGPSVAAVAPDFADLLDAAEERAPITKHDGACPGRRPNN